MASLPVPSVMPTEAESKLGEAQIRVLIGLRSPMECQLLLSAIKHSREPFAVVGCSVSKDEILRSFSQRQIDVALVNSDLVDGHLSGLQILPQIHAYHQKTSVIMLFDAWHDELIVQAFRTGANGVFCRSTNKLDLLWKCISAVHGGQVWANSEQLRLLLNAFRNVPTKRPVSSRGLKSLAKRETEVAELVAEGLQNKDIGVRLGISEHTVSNYLFRIYNKLGISNRVELVLYFTAVPLKVE